ncbi:MAG: CARDB domain-containing protein [Halobacteriota archaeon]|nr:CARDB domain-containing protein [Halobacteriota archaeon]
MDRRKPSIAMVLIYLIALSPITAGSINVLSSILESQSSSEILICGYIFEREGFVNLDVTCPNRNLSCSADILELNPKPDFYYISIQVDEITSGDILIFNATSNYGSVILNHTVTNEEINSRTIWVNITEDLIIRNYEILGHLLNGHEVRIRGIVENIGEAPVIVPFNISLSVDGIIINSSTVSVEELPLESDNNITVDFNWTLNRSGNHTISILVDPENKIGSEVNRSNNNLYKDIYINESSIIRVPSDYNTIQEAIESIQYDGAVIIVSEGIYRENIIADKEISIIGEGFEKTIIDGSKGDVVKLLSDNSTFKGFKVTNGSCGIKVESNNCTISQNQIDNNSIGIDILGKSNLIIHNNFDNSKNAMSNSGNSFDDGREGNFWSEHSGEDLNFDGLIDEAYEDDNIIDFYPLLSPFESGSDPAISYLTIPNVAYVNESSQIYIGLVNYGSSDALVDVVISVKDDYFNQTIDLPYKSRYVIPLNITSKGNGTSVVSATIESVLDDINDKNNGMNTSFEVKFSPLRTLYSYNASNLDEIEEYGKYELPEARMMALRYIERLQNTDGGFGISGDSTALAILGVASAGREPSEFRKDNGSLTHFLRKKGPARDPISVAQFTQAITAVGADPRDFNGTNYIALLESNFDGEQFGIREDVTDDSWVLLALIGSGYDTDSEMIVSSLDHILERQNSVDGGWGSMSATGVAIEALVAAGISEEDESIRRGVDYLRNNIVKDQWKDGNGQTDPLPNSTVINYINSNQAIFASAENPIDGSWDYMQDPAIYHLGYRDYDPLILLLGLQEDEDYAEGGFKHSFSTYSPLPPYTALALPAIYAKPYPLFVQVPNDRLLDIEPIQIATSEVFSNVTGKVTSMIKNEGGVFHVGLLVDGVLIEEKRVEEFGSDAITPVDFIWRPENPKVYNLSVIVDSHDKIDERNEENNHITEFVDVDLPDLQIKSNFPVFYSNVTNTIDFNVTGYGESFNNSLIQNDTVISRIVNLTAYGKKNSSAFWKPDHEGNYTLQLVVDYDSDVVESNEENNRITREVNVTLPDIYPVKITPPNAIYTDTDNVFNVTVDGYADSFNATLWSNSTFIDRRTKIESKGRSDFNFTWNPKKEGLYNLTLILDDDEDLFESNEENNTLNTSVTVENRVAPVIKLTSPLGGETLSGTHMIRWEAFDPNGDVLTIDLNYSPDGGHLFIPLEEGLPNTGSYLWDTSMIQDGFNYVVEATAFDKKLSSSDRSKHVFTISNRKSNEETDGFHPNSGFSTSDAPNTPDVLWISEYISAVPVSSLAAAEGKVFVLCDDCTLKALNDETGEVMWETDINCRVQGSWSTPVYSGGYVFASSGNSVYRIDADDGRVDWEYKFTDDGCSVNGGPCVSYNRVYVGSWDGGHYYCIDEESGDELWKFAIFDDPHEYGRQEDKIHYAQSTPVAHDNVVYFGDFSPNIPGKVYAVDAFTGREIWNQTVEHGVCGTLTVAHEKVYFMTFSFGRTAPFYALDRYDGSIVWTHEISESDSTPSHAYGNIYVSGGVERIAPFMTYCLNDKEEGREVFTRPGLGSWTFSPMVADEKVFVGTANESDGIYALHYTTGDTIWHSVHGGGSPIVVNGRVYSTDENGKVVCFGSNDTIDLEPTDLGISDEVYTNQLYSFNATIRNNGPSEVKAFNTSFRVDGDLELEIRSENLTGYGEVMVPFEWNPTDPGEHLLIIEADSGKEVVETDPFNNVLNVTVDVIEGSDVVVNNVGCPDNISPGSTTIKPEISAFYLEKELVEVKLLINGKNAGEIKEEVQGERINIEFNWKPTEEGTYNVTIFADPNGNISETSEENNILSKDVRVIRSEDNSLKTGIGSGGGSGGGVHGGIGSGEGPGKGEGLQSGGIRSPVNTSEARGEESDTIVGYKFGGDKNGGSGGNVRNISMISILATTLILVIILFSVGYFNERRNIRSRK